MMKDERPRRPRPFEVLSWTAEDCMAWLAAHSDMNIIDLSEVIADCDVETWRDVVLDEIKAPRCGAWWRKELPKRWRGVVEAVRDGLAYLTLEAESDGRRLEIEWNAEELAALGIVERSPFTLRVHFDERHVMRTEFKASPPRLLSIELVEMFKGLSKHYNSPEWLDDKLLAPSDGR